MYVEKLTIRDFRCFADTELELNYPGRRATKLRRLPRENRSVNLFLGSNGSGKSSVFKALALGVLAPVIQSSGFKAEYLVRRVAGKTPTTATNGAKRIPSRSSAEVRATLILDEHDTVLEGIEGAENRRVIGQTVIERTGDVEKIPGSALVNEALWEQIYFNDSPSFFLSGYGANRRTVQPESYTQQGRTPRYRRVATLFEDHFGLVPFSYGYLQLQGLGFLDEARRLLNRLLPDGVALTEQLDSERQPLFEREAVLLPFNALSDGFRAFVGWVWDLLFQMALAQAAPDVQATQGSEAIAVYKEPEKKRLADMSGVVIVDEIDLFLHPEWQRLVVEQVAKTFPKLQFLFSSHSPLVAGTLEPENIFVLERAPDGTAVVEQYRENIHGLTANQVLTSSYFRLDSVRAPNTGTLNDLAKRMLSEPQKLASEMLQEIAEE